MAKIHKQSACKDVLGDGTLLFFSFLFFSFLFFSSLLRSSNLIHCVVAGKQSTAVCSNCKKEEMNSPAYSRCKSARYYVKRYIGMSARKGKRRGEER